VDLQITKTGPATAAVGSAIQYRLTYRNNSAIAVPAGAEVVDSLPAWLTFVSASPNATSISGATRRWTLTALAAGASGTITINATVNPNAPASVSNTATITVPTGQTDTTPGNNTSTVTTQILLPDLQIIKSGPAIAVVGAPLQYTLTWRNTTAVAIPAGAVIQDSLPTGLIYVSSSPAAVVSGSTLSWTLGAIAANQSAAITVGTTVDTSAPASVSNTGTIGMPSGWPDSTPGNNTSTVTTQIQRPDVGIVKTGPATALISDTLSFTLAYRNAGSAPAAGVVVQDTLPAGLAFVSAVPAPSSVVGQVMRWNISGPLVPNASGTITVQARVLLSAAIAQVNTGTISTTSAGDNNPGNDISTTTTTILRPNVKITKTAPANTAEMSQLQYRLDYVNNGNVAAANVVVRDVLPAGLTFGAASPAPSSVAGQALSWNLGTLSPNQSGSIVITTRVAVGTGGTTLDNTGVIATTTAGDDPADNTSSISTYVIVPPPPPQASTDWKLAIRSMLDPLSLDSNPTNGVYVSLDSNVHWPAGEVLDWTPRVQISLPGASPIYPYAFRAKIVGWGYVSTGVEGTDRLAIAADDMPGHGAGCRAGDRSSDGAGLNGCTYRYIGTGELNDATVPAEADMNGQAHGYWGVGVPLSMRNDVYTYSMSQLGAVTLNVQIKVVIETYNVEDPTGQMLRTRTDTPSNTYTLTLVVPRDLK
ncbi:MAG: hypothetical protein ABI901_04010, partial [Roseiflexaceae bacterium]